MYIYIYIYIYMYIYTYTYMNVYVCTCIHTHTYVYPLMFTGVHFLLYKSVVDSPAQCTTTPTSPPRTFTGTRVWMFENMLFCLSISLCSCICIYMYTYIYAFRRIHIYIHEYLYTRTCIYIWICVYMYIIYLYLCLNLSLLYIHTHAYTHLHIQIIRNDDATSFVMVLAMLRLLKLLRLWKISEMIDSLSRISPQYANGKTDFRFPFFVCSASGFFFEIIDGLTFFWISCTPTIPLFAFCFAFFCSACGISGVIDTLSRKSIHFANSANVCQFFFESWSDSSIVFR